MDNLNTARSCFCSFAHFTLGCPCASNVTIFSRSSNDKPVRFSVISESVKICAFLPYLFLFRKQHITYCTGFTFNTRHDLSSSRRKYFSYLLTTPRDTLIPEKVKDLSQYVLFYLCCFPTVWNTFHKEQ